MRSRMIPSEKLRTSISCIPGLVQLKCKQEKMHERPVRLACPHVMYTVVREVKKAVHSVSHS